MTIRSFLLALGVAVVAGCSGRQSATETPADHPAHPTAAEVPTQPRSRTLQDQGTATSSPSGDNQIPAGVVYTCPHHPEVVSKEPGVCPKCDMKLQPKKGGDGAAGGAGTGTSGATESHEGHGSHEGQ